MQIDPDVLSLHRGLLLFVESWVCEKPRVSIWRPGPFTGSGGPAPSSHHIQRGLSAGLSGYPPGVGDDELLPDAGGEEKGLNSAILAIIGLPIIIGIVSIIVWAVAQAVT